jgi:hypothetical protein
MTSGEARDFLVNKETGTFLFRFSSKPKTYTLSVANSSGVSHWRILCTRNVKHGVRFTIGKGSESFASLTDLARAYAKIPLDVAGKGLTLTAPSNRLNFRK